MLMRRLTVCVSIVSWVVTDVKLCTGELIASLGYSDLRSIGDLNSH